MPETLTKLRPDRDLQCYFRRPSAIAALSQTSAQGFTVSGTWREQFDWSVIEWNRDNTFEHPALRNLPDGDLSHIRLSYEEVRSNCIPLDSKLFPTVDWPFLRVWADPGAGEQIYKVRLLDLATPIEGGYSPAAAIFTLSGTMTAGDQIELAWEMEHYNYILAIGDTADSALAALTNIINSFPAALRASSSGNQITLALKDAVAGSGGNRLGVYGNVSGSGSEAWNPVAQQLAGGLSPTKWRIDLDFGVLKDYTHNPAGDPVPMNNVRKMRWTYAADLQAGAFNRSEFAAVISNWSVTGTGLNYSVAGSKSRRIQDDSPDVAYTGAWTSSRGNFSGGSIRSTTEHNASLTCSYTASQQHQLYLGTRRAFNGSQISVSVDGEAAQSVSLLVADEDTLTRIPLGIFEGQQRHTVRVTNTRVTNAGDPASYFYFDFLEIAVPDESLPNFNVDSETTLATDWDTDHSIALAPERTAWLISKLGFQGRANHYTGALWFYEMIRAGHVYASSAIDFTGTPAPNFVTTVSIDGSALAHVHLAGDTAISIAKAFELRANNGFTGVWARATGITLTITARAMGVAGNQIAISAATNQAAPAPVFEPAIAGGGAFLAGGVDGINANITHMDDAANKGWRTDLTALPRINRAARDWTRSFFAALQSYGITATAAFSTELQHGDPSTDAGIVQRYHSGNPVVLNTPALQTNFSPASLAFWQQVHLDMAQVMVESGQPPYLQFGEVQWWYFADDGSSLPFYDDYTLAQFSAAYGRPLGLIANNTTDPAAFPQEAAFLPALVGTFTNQIMQFVRHTYPAARFEVLYAPDVNDFPFTRIINLPRDAWTPANLDCLKTENFSYTYARNLDKALESVLLPQSLGFARANSSHLVGISDYTTPWVKEAGLGFGQKVESVVLFALDQFCLNGYAVALRENDGRSLFMG